MYCPFPVCIYGGVHISVTQNRGGWTRAVHIPQGGRHTIISISQFVQWVESSAAKLIQKISKILQNIHKILQNIHKILRNNPFPFQF
jgi:hypothetical protein